jgi:hypothetical protein
VKYESIRVGRANQTKQRTGKEIAPHLLYKSDLPIPFAISGRLYSF